MSKVKELLRGYGVDLENLQTVGNMTVIPIVSEQEFAAGVADVDEVELTKDVDYGTLRFTNQSGQIGIVMQGASIITQQRAQDRTVPQATILKGKGSVNVDAFCVQSSQGGHFRTSELKEEFKDEPPYKILPPTLRSLALTRSYGGGHSYSNLWRDLEGYTGTYANLRASSHLVDLYTKYKDDLDKFVAQFEPVPHQLGAIVMIDQEVVAVDIMPTHRSWKVMWKTLIRDSYGAEAIRTAGAGKGIVWAYNLKLDNITDLQSLEDEMHRTVSALFAAIKERWEEVDKEMLVQDVQQDLQGVRRVNVASDRFMGQAVIHDEHCVYLSLIPKGSTRERRENLRRRSQNYSNEEFNL